MILKKPYAFLIKHFRLIHLIISVLLIYLAIKTTSIVGYFNTIVQEGYYLGDNIAGVYINFYMYLAVILILGMLLAIYLLFRTKEKPTRFYRWGIVYYTFLFFMITICFSVLQNLEVTLVEAKDLRMYRDLSLIISLPQYFFCVFMILRSIGFDIKKFNFKKDISELQVEEQDNEEFELNIDVEGYKIKRKIRRFFREFKYYFLENKFACILALAILVIAVGTTILLNRRVYSRTYQENQTFSLSNYQINIVDSIITPFSYNGQIIEKDKYFVVVLFSINNPSAWHEPLETSNFWLLAGNKRYYPTSSRSEHFVDLGDVYKEQDIPTMQESSYLLIYEIDKEDLQDSYSLKIEDSLDYYKGEIIAKYRQTTLNPVLVDEKNIIEEKNLNEEISFKDSVVGNSKLTIKGHEWTRSYRYNYDYCVGEKCYIGTNVIDATFKTNTNKTLLILDYDLTLDDSHYSRTVKNNVNFFKYFLNLEYTLNGKTYKITGTNKTPVGWDNKYIIEVDEYIKNASDIKLVFTIRNKIYKINLN